MHEMASRLDRLIAFLDSYFGNVELLDPADERRLVKAVNPKIKVKSVEQQPDQDSMATDQPAADTDKTDDEKKALANVDEKQDQEEEDEEEEEEEMVDLSDVPVVRVTLDSAIADVSVQDLTVHSDDEQLKKRVDNVVQLAMSVLVPLANGPAFGSKHVEQDDPEKLANQAAAALSSK